MLNVPVLAGLRELAPRYDGFVLDLWGTLHDGFAPFPGVVDCLERLKAAGKAMVVLSNAPRRADTVLKRMLEIGIPSGLCDQVMSSGEEAWQHLLRRDDPFYQALGHACYHIGPPRDDDMLRGAGLTPVKDVTEAEFILNTGPWGWEETVAAYEPMLQAARQRDLPMVCANPDLSVIHGGAAVICAGALAKRYEEIGGRVRWHGKPFPSVYDACFAMLGQPDRRRVLAIGDSLRTDIAGANAVGIDSVLVAGGLHAEEFGLANGAVPDRQRLNATIVETGARPSGLIACLCW